jgi:hypothetical protein
MPQFVFQSHLRFVMAVPAQSAIFHSLPAGHGSWSGRQISVRTDVTAN